MKNCVIIPMDEYEKIYLHVTHAIHILDHARVSKDDRADALRSLRVVLETLNEA